jgi:folate-binding protein YgfZ
VTVLIESSPLLAWPGAVAVPAGEPDAGVAAHYGDPLREQRALSRAAGLVDRSHRGLVAVTGADRLSWLTTLSTQLLAALRPGEASELLLLSPHGHLEHHAVLVDDGETAWLSTEPGAAPALLDFLTSMRFMLRVEPRDATPEYATLTVAGPKAAKVLAATGAVVPADPEVLPVPGAKFATGDVPRRSTSRYGVATLPGGGFVIHLPAFPLSTGVDDEGSAEVFDLLIPRDRLVETAFQLRDAAAVPAGSWAFEALRVAARRPRFGVDSDHRTIPHEAGDLLARAVHLDKGCYRGQETVARVHNLGRPPRRLVLLHLDGVDEELPAPGTAVSRDGRQVGVTGTAARHHELGLIALALLKQNVPAGETLRVGDATAAADPD